MTLGDLWLIIGAIFWVGFFVLEGFDFGVGMLHSFLGRTDTERRVIINCIGPVWDGNEVWLIVAGAVIFAAFPGWYATMFSALYLALVLALVALIVRGLSFEFQRKFADRALASLLALGIDDRQRPHPLPTRGGARRPAPRAPDQQPARVHRGLLAAADPLRALDRADTGGPVAALGRHLPQPQDHRRAAGARPNVPQSASGWPR